MRLSPEDWHKRYAHQARWTQPIRSYLYQRINYLSSTHVLEVGCGTGVILSELVASGLLDVHGLDINPGYLDVAMRNIPAAKLTTGDAHHLPYYPNTFDLTLCHFLLLWVTHPIQAVAEMMRVTQPGKPVIALAEPDYHARIDFPDQLIVLGQLQSDSLQKQGANPSLGRKLGSIFSNAGLQNIETGVLGGQWSSFSNQDDLNSEWQVLNSDLEFISDEFNLSRHELLQLQDLDITARQRGERVLFVPTFYALGFVPGRLPVDK